MRGTYLKEDILESEAFKHLTLSAIRIFIGLRRRLEVENRGTKRRTKWESTNNGELVYTYDEIQQEWPISSRGTIAAAWDSLVEKGLVDITKTGSGIHKRESRYAISERWRKWHPNKQRRKSFGFEEQSRPRSDKNPGFGTKRSKNSQVQSTVLETPFSSTVNRTNEKSSSAVSCT